MKKLILPTFVGLCIFFGSCQKEVPSPVSNPVSSVPAKQVLSTEQERLLSQIRISVLDVKSGTRSESPTNAENHLDLVGYYIVQSVKAGNELE